jgi:2-oxoglutarate ferredoxin oxidoreductase subunit delta
MSEKQDPTPIPQCDCAAAAAKTISEKDLEELKNAHSCTLEEALVLMGEELKTCKEPVYVFKKWCKGCNICVELCPKQTLALGADIKAYQHKPEDCILCGLCELRCPDLAIFVVQKKKKKSKAGK